MLPPAPVSMYTVSASCCVWISTLEKSCCAKALDANKRKRIAFIFETSQGEPILKVCMAQSLTELREDAKRCQDCPLWANATQTVFGAGDPHARVMLVGEQPGDEEDRKGLPFVGPAGRLLDRALEAAGVERRAVYITNAVKHFKWQLRGKRRLHKTPAQREIDACHQW